MNYAKLLLLSVTLYVIPALSIEESLPTISLEEAIRTSNPKVVASFIRHLEPLDSKQRDALLNLAQKAIEVQIMAILSFERGVPALTVAGSFFISLGTACCVAYLRPGFTGSGLVPLLNHTIGLFCIAFTTVKLDVLTKKYENAVSVKSIIATARVVDVNAVAA